MTQEEKQTIIFYAFRYALGRQTYAVHDVVSILKKEWSDLSLQYRTLVQNEIKVAISKGHAGHSTIDLPEWESILKLPLIDNIT